MLWKLLTDKNTDKNIRESNNSDQTDSDDDIEGNYKFKEREYSESSPPFQTVMYNVDGTDISPQCCIQQFFGGADFLTSIVKRKTVVQLGSLGRCCKPSPVGSRGEILEIFGYFAF